MPRHNYWKVAPLVKSLCAKHSLEYQCKPLLTAFADIVQWVKINPPKLQEDAGETAILRARVFLLSFYPLGQVVTFGDGAMQGWVGLDPCGLSQLSLLWDSGKWAQTKTHPLVPATLPWAALWCVLSFSQLPEELRRALAWCLPAQIKDKAWCY